MQIQRHRQPTRSPALSAHSRLLLPQPPRAAQRQFPASPLPRRILHAARRISYGTLPSTRRPYPLQRNPCGIITPRLTSPPSAPTCMNSGSPVRTAHWYPPLTLPASPRHARAVVDSPHPQRPQRVEVFYYTDITFHRAPTAPPPPTAHRRSITTAGARTPCSPRAPGPDHCTPHALNVQRLDTDTPRRSIRTPHTYYLIPPHAQRSDNSPRFKASSFIQ